MSLWFPAVNLLQLQQGLTQSPKSWFHLIGIAIVSSPHIYVYVGMILKWLKSLYSLPFQADASVICDAFFQPWFWHLPWHSTCKLRAHHRSRSYGQSKPMTAKDYHRRFEVLMPGVGVAKLKNDASRLIYLAT